MLKRQIAGNTAFQFTGKIISTLIGIGALMIMTRSLGAVQFGWYATAVGFLQFVFILSDFGFTVITANLLAEAKFEKNKLYGVIFTWRLITALAFQILAIILIWFFPYSLYIKLATVISSLAFFSIAVNQIFTGYYQARLKTYVLALGELFGRLALITGITLFAYWQTGFLPMMLIIVLASLINTGYLWHKSEKINLSFDKEISLYLGKKIWPVALAVIFNAVYLHGDRFLLPLFVPAFEVGFYTAGYRILDIITQMAAMIMGIMLPILTYSWTTNNHINFKKQAQWSFDMVMLVLLPIMCGAIVLAEPLMRLIGGKEFIMAGPILQILSVAVFGICFGMIFGHIALAINKQKQVLWVYATGAFFSLIGYLLFIPSYGAYGAGYVTIFSELYAGTLLFALTAHYAKFIPRLKKFLKIFLASLLMSGIIYFLPSSINVIFKIILGAIIYSVLILILKIISQKTLKELLHPEKMV